MNTDKTARLLALLFLGSTAWAQGPKLLQCGTPQDSVLDQTQVGADGRPFQRFQFSAQAGDAAFIHTVGYSPNTGFQLGLFYAPDNTAGSILDPFGNHVHPRPAAPKPAAGTNPVPLPGSTPYFLAQQGFESDLAVDGIFPVQVIGNTVAG